MRCGSFVCSLTMPVAVLSTAWLPERVAAYAEMPNTRDWNGELIICESLCVKWRFPVLYLCFVLFGSSSNGVHGAAAQRKVGDRYCRHSWCRDTSGYVAWAEVGLFGSSSLLLLFPCPCLVRLQLEGQAHILLIRSNPERQRWPAWDLNLIRKWTPGQDWPGSP